MLRHAVLLFAVLNGCAGPTSTGDHATERSSPKTGCSIDDMKPTSEDERTLLLNIARRCKPIDQCLLECIRSGCADGIGGGCFHTCGIRGVPPGERDAVLLQEAAKYRARTHYFCRSREHESR